MKTIHKKIIDFFEKPLKVVRNYFFAKIILVDDQGEKLYLPPKAVVKGWQVATKDKGPLHPEDAPALTHYAEAMQLSGHALTVAEAYEDAADKIDKVLFRPGGSLAGAKRDYEL